VAERKVVVALSGADVQAVEQAVLDRDGESALDFLVRVVKPRIDAELGKGHCRPVFELPRGADGSIARPSSPPGG